MSDLADLFRRLQLGAMLADAHGADDLGSELRKIANHLLRACPPELAHRLGLTQLPGDDAVESALLDANMAVARKAHLTVIG